MDSHDSTELCSTAEDGVIVIAGARYYTDEGLAALLGVTTRTLLRWNDRRIGPPKIKIGAKSLYAEERLPGWLNAREQQPPRSARCRRAGGPDAHRTA